MNAKYLVVAMMGLGLSAVGCFGTATNEELAATDWAGYEAQENPTGGGTTNHLLPDIYHANKYKLLSAMGHPLATVLCIPGWGCGPTHAVSSNILNTGLLNTSEGRDLFNMAVECALEDGQYVSQSNPSRTYTGKGLMSTTAGWYMTALTTDQKEDVLRCVIARVNMNGATVNIVLSGQNVTNQPDEDHSTVDWKPDALWDVQVLTIPGLPGSPSRPAIYEYAWPIADVAANPSNAGCFTVTSAMEARVCDQASSNCSFEVSEYATNDCYRYDMTQNGTTAEYYRCTPSDPTAGRPVVQSWVDANGLVALYPLCTHNVPPAINMDPSFIPDAP